jgi:uncharacterized protein
LRANCCSLKSLKTYSIPFTGLKLGKHYFEYEINDAFFAEFDYSLVKKANLICKVELDKQETMLILNFDIHRHHKCHLRQVPVSISATDGYSEQQIARFSEEVMSEDDEIITLVKTITRSIWPG